MTKCIHNWEPLPEPLEESVEVHTHLFRITRIRRAVCTLCDDIGHLKVDRDAVASGRAVDDYYGLNYERV